MPSSNSGPCFGYLSLRESDGPSQPRLSVLLLSREEPRPHVHVQHSTGEAKLWLDPKLEVAQNYGLPARRLAVALRIAEEHYDEIRATWDAHFRR